MEIDYRPSKKTVNGNDKEVVIRVFSGSYQKVMTDEDEKIIETVFVRDKFLGEKKILVNTFDDERQESKAALTSFTGEGVRIAPHAK